LVLPPESAPPTGIYIPLIGGPTNVRQTKKPEDIVLKLRQVEVLQSQGKALADAVRQIGVTVQTYYRWRKQYDGIS
jgi:hypothetical protein